MNSWNDFNSAEDQTNFEIIPVGTLVKVRMTIKPGGYDDVSQGWTNGYATRNSETGSIFLNAEFVVVAGQYVKRKVWSNVGLFSANPDNRWAAMGRSFIRGILNSARGIMPKDDSPNAQAARRINSFADIDGIEFVGRISIGEDKHGGDKNEITQAITPDHKEYAAIMGNTAFATAPAGVVSPPPNQPARSPAPSSTGKPSWAQ